ncbi:MAG: hypothetical protein ACFFBD_28540, partial [Candidatus Hodarchaeota archaeon]
MDLWLGILRFFFAPLANPLNVRQIPLTVTPNNPTYPWIDGLTVEYYGKTPIFTTITSNSVIQFALNGTVFKKPKIWDAYFAPSEIVSLGSGNYCLFISSEDRTENLIITVDTQGTVSNIITLDSGITSFGILNLSSNPELIISKWPSNAIQKQTSSGDIIES